MSGDYEFLCKMYGLSGAAGTFCYIHNILAILTIKSFTRRHFCLYCTASKDQIQVNTEVPLRSLESLNSDHERFLQSGGNLKIVQKFNNVMQKPFFKVPLIQVY